MSKIKTIRINNFKFFRESSTIDLEGKHLLLYGENGCGKSSLSFGLYTLLEAATKQPADVQKYFELPSNNENSLVNIWANLDSVEATNSYVEIVDDQEHTYRVSFKDTDVCANPFLLESQRASDFISYKSLFQFQLFKISEPCDLRDIFEYSVLPYMSFPTFNYLGRDYTSATELWKCYRNQPQRLPNRRTLVYKRSREYSAYVLLEKHLNRCMQDLIQYINFHCHEIIEQLGYDFKVKLEYTPTFHKKRDTAVDISEYHIMLSLIEYEGLALSNKHPNTFLNEAKMAALAFAIRWAILDYRVSLEASAEAMKFVVLDDLMISLDLGNRNKLIKFIIDKLLDNFQIIFLTHSRSVFEYMLSTLKQKYNIKQDEELDKYEWKVLEMYDVEKNDHHEPLLQDHKSLIAKALNYMNGAGTLIDYNACGNILRQAMESEFNRIFKETHFPFSENGMSDEKSCMLGNYIEYAKINFESWNLDVSVVNDLENLRVFLLNPTSHYNPEKNYYKRELQDAFKIYDCLTKMRAREVVLNDKIFNFSITCKNTGKHLYQVKLYEDILASQKCPSSEFQIILSSYHGNIREATTPKSKWHEVKGTLLEIILETIKYYKTPDDIVDSIDESNYLDKIFYKGLSLNELCSNLSR